jgi:hypothetical protein
VCPACRNDPRDGSVIRRVIELAWNAEKVGQIEVPDPQHVNAINRGDSLDMLQSPVGFNLGND